jgi:octopine/nopaline transport system permease protein
MLNTAAYSSEVLRAGLLAVPKGQIEAARACGMSRLLMARRIVFPIVLRRILPAYGNEIILMVKATSLASTVTLMEVTGIAAVLIAQTYRSLEIFSCAAAVYLAINFAVTRLVRALEYRLGPETRLPGGAPIRHGRQRAVAAHRARPT